MNFESVIVACFAKCIWNSSAVKFGGKPRTNILEESIVQGAGREELHLIFKTICMQGFVHALSENLDPAKIIGDATASCTKLQYLTFHN